MNLIGCDGRTDNPGLFDKKYENKNVVQSFVGKRMTRLCKLVLDLNFLNKNFTTTKLIFDAKQIHSL
jgi:hypothetical protein